MAPRKIKPGVYSVGAIDWDRRLFDALIPLPQGTSYNAFVVVGSQKTALIDSVDPSKWPDGPPDPPTPGSMSKTGISSGFEGSFGGGLLEGSSVFGLVLLGVGFVLLIGGVVLFTDGVVFFGGFLLSMTMTF